MRKNYTFLRKCKVGSFIYSEQKCSVSWINEKIYLIPGCEIYIYYSISGVAKHKTVLEFSRHTKR